MSKTFKDRRRQFDNYDQYIKFKTKRKARAKKRKQLSKEAEEIIFKEGLIL